MIGIKSSGSFANIEAFFKHVINGRLFSDLNHYGRMGVDALSQATPVNSGETARSWDYKITNNQKRIGIEWFNTHVNDGANIAILIQYGHATGTGGYVAGQDYINPAIRPVFDQISDNIWKKVTNA